jgi:hypothetical protein
MKNLDRYHAQLIGFSGVLNVVYGTKIKGGIDTGEPSVVVFVSKKKPMSMLSLGEVIPVKCDGIQVDVQEMNTPDFRLGSTSVSKLPPSVQKRIASGVSLKDGSS